MKLANNWCWLTVFGVALCNYSVVYALDSNNDGIAENHQATVLFLSMCGIGNWINDRVIPPSIQPKATVQFDWSEGIQMTFGAVANVEEEPSKNREWSFYGSSITSNGQTYPTELIKFDGSHLSSITELPSMIRQKEAVGTLRTAHIGEMAFSKCQDYLLHTAFGKRRTIECEGVGLIAEDEYFDTHHSFEPSERVVAVRKIDWEYPKYNDVTKIPPYWKELMNRVAQLASTLDFFGSCNVDFLDMLSK
jgi:hypothetical protein